MTAIFDQMRVAFLKELESLASDARGLLCAVSGGSDSVGMLHLATSAGLDTPIVVGFVDHGLRANIAEEWDFVKGLCDARGIEAVKLAIPGNSAPPGGEGLQQWAREHRYQLLQELAGQKRLSHILTAHTQDDQAETVLLRMIRGSGIDGIGGIPRSRIQEGIAIIRPMLPFGRSDIQRILREASIPWVSDPSNLDTRFARVDIRNNLIPLLRDMNPSISQHLSRLATDAVSMSESLDEFIVGKIPFDNLCLYSGVRVGSQALRPLPHGLRARVVRKAIRSATGSLRRMERVHIEGILEGLESNTGTRQFNVPGAASVYVAYGDLYVFPQGIVAPNSVTAMIQDLPSGPTLQAGIAELGVRVLVEKSSVSQSMDGLCLRTRQTGARIHGSSRTLSRFLIDCKVPEFYRNFVPLLCDDQNCVISIPGLLKSAVKGLHTTWEISDGSPVNDVINIETNK